MVAMVVAMMIMMMIMTAVIVIGGYMVRKRARNDHGMEWTQMDADGHR